jgi:hypothetical protein
METFVAYINERQHGLQQLLPMLEKSEPAHWVLVACPPRMNRHTGRWLTHSARKKWQARWAEQTLQELIARIEAKGDQVTQRIANAPLVQLTRELRSEFGRLRVIDARRPPMGADLPAVSAEQPQEQHGWTVPVGIVALGAAVSLVTE